MEVQKGFKFNILEFFMSKTENKMDVETTDIPKVFVDPSLVRMFMEIRAEKEILGKTFVDTIVSEKKEIIIRP
jgi:hypothetical protein